MHLRVRVQGSGRPLLLVMGIGGNIEMWDPLVDALDGFETIAFDAPGTGESSRPRRPLWMTGLARVVARLLARVPPGRRARGVLRRCRGPAAGPPGAGSRPAPRPRLDLVRTGEHPRQPVRSARARQPTPVPVGEVHASDRAPPLRRRAPSRPGRARTSPPGSSR